MSARPNDLALKQIGRLFRDGTVAGLGDGELIARFVARRDETAFEALVSRHGPMVLGVCRRMLTDSHDADDAFQATFLVLVRKARGIRDTDRLAPWLYGVAHRIAGRARILAARRAANEKTGTDVEPAARMIPDELVDVRSIIDAELARLSAKHREVLVLCLLEGLSPDEAAARLRCPTGTIKSRLARGRETLKTRLTARGLAPTLVASAVLGSAESVRASSVPERLLTPLLRAAMDPTGSLTGIGIGAAILTREAAIPMVSKSLTITALVVTGIGLGTFGLVESVKSRAVAQDEVPGNGGIPPTATPGTESGGGGTPSVAETKPPPLVVTANNLKKILLAFHNYHDANGRLPYVSISRPGGQPGLSWRVEILPFLGQNELYNKFHLDEPFNSPHNAALVSEMPQVFQTPDHPAPAGQTRIQGFHGEGTAFNWDVSFAKVLDGTSNTAMLGVSARPAVWTAPEALKIDQGSPLPQLEDSDTDGPLLGMMDGSLRRLKPEMLLRGGVVLRALTSIAGGEVISSDVFVSRPATTPDALAAVAGLPTPPTTPPLSDPPAAAPTAPLGGPPIAEGGMSASMGPSSSTPAIEQRLEAIERKLDLLLQRSQPANASAEGRALPNANGDPGQRR